ncbi:MAG TPA: SGNH/GDSL hydrolase family protein [Rhodocyclaceae bacterium]|nr:SGNH/GDSL hydrolase family protein [Rhodocyclaceae bacterium]
MKHLAATVGLGPLLLLQGRYVKRSIPTLPEPPGERQGWVADYPATPLRLLMIGDSAAAGVGARHQAEALSGHLVKALAQASIPLSWRLHAQTGATTAHCLKQLRLATPQPYDVVVVSLGVNDLTTGCSVAHWIEQQAQLTHQLQQRFEARLILLSALPPIHLFPALPQPLRWYLGAQARRYNQALARWAAHRYPDCEYVRADFALNPQLMAHDGFHPGPALYAQWAQALAEKIRHHHRIGRFVRQIAPTRVAAL